jgi:pimeloyl-ACP methyl ester carboxylesterase
MKIETVRTKEFEMEYFRFGDGAQTMVILPGLSIQSVMRSAMIVAKQYEMFCADFTVYVFDRRKKLPAAYSVRDMARDTAQAMEALGLRDVCLFGASQGGMMAIVIAAEYPHLVKKLALGSAAARLGEREYRGLGHWVQRAKDGDKEGLYLAFGEAIYPPAIFEEYRDALVMIAKTVTDEELKRFVVLAEGTQDLDLTEELAGIQCPVLTIGAKDDRVLGAGAGRLIADILREKDGCEYFEYDGYGHAAFDTAPDYKERLYRFFME